MSGSCAAGVCLPPSCSDRISNGDETGVDCGGTCLPCAPGMACQVASDCASLNCDSSLCVDPGFGAPARSGVSTQTISFETAQVARYIKIELAVGGVNWWSIGEMSVLQ